jgi:rhamnopyranosyl-N-acetylglucosaminyl-diphospho-decaprenol beta-1,3/1,4-galactofuranosyltransferase
MTEQETICAVVVTYNRKRLLRRCLNALLSQTRLPDKIIVTDNASKDGTEEMLHNTFRNNAIIEYINLGANLGGGGGFNYGARKAFAEGYDWVWMMDDDCLATKGCLKSLMGDIDDPKNVYSPIILSIENKRKVLWGIKAKINSGNKEVTTLPFNGFLIHRDSLRAIGFPKKEFFIYGDDTEFNMRAKIHGKKIIMVTASVMYHPYKNNASGLKIYKMFLNKLWTYYKLRNAIIIYKRYRYLSVNQVIMFSAAAMFYLMTINFKFLGLFLKGLKDGIKGKLYVNESLV